MSEFVNRELTWEEAKAAYDAAPSLNVSEERIKEIVAAVVGEGSGKQKAKDGEP